MADKHFLVDKIKTRTSRGQSSRIQEIAKNDVRRRGSQRTTDDSKVASTGTQTKGARTNVRSTIGSNGGKGEVINTGTAATSQTQHESFTVQFTVKMKSAAVDPYAPAATPPISNGPGPGL